MHSSLILTLLTVVVFMALLGSTYLYKHNGKRHIFRIDFVQFIYLFLLTPMLFIWSKTFLFYLVRNELGLGISTGEMFTIDTVFSVMSFYVFAAVAIHSLTKTFWLRRRDDPEFDIFHLSEYFHLWWTHIAIYGGGMILLSFISAVNIFITVPLYISKVAFMVTAPILGTFFGIISFISMWLSNPLQKQTSFLKIMKILIACFFALHAAAYILIRPDFSAEYGLFWFVFFAFLSMGIFGVFVERTERADELLSFFKHFGWGNNISVLERKVKHGKS